MFILRYQPLSQIHQCDLFIRHHWKQNEFFYYFYFCSDIISSELCKAVKLNRQSKLKVLIDFPGININFKENGKVPLMHIPWHHEIFEDCLQIEKLLLARNANLDEVDCQGISAR